MFGVPAFRCNPKSTEILTRIWIINDFSIWHLWIGKKMFLSISHYVTFLVYDVTQISIPPCIFCYASNKSELPWSKREMALIVVHISILIYLMGKTYIVEHFKDEIKLLILIFRLIKKLFNWEYVIVQKKIINKRYFRRNIRKM